MKTKSLKTESEIFCCFLRVKWFKSITKSVIFGNYLGNNFYSVAGPQEMLTKELKLKEMYLFWLSYLLIFHSDHILFDRVIQE